MIDVLGGGAGGEDGEGGGNRVAAHVVAQGAVGVEAADAAAQLAVDGQGDEAGAPLGEVGVIETGGGLQAEGVGDGLAGLAEEGPAEEGVSGGHGCDS